MKKLFLFTLVLTGCSGLGSAAVQYAPENDSVEEDTSSDSSYICSYNAYNCTDFSSRSVAWEVFNTCMSEVGYDVHDLDRDNDGPCDSL